MRSDMNWKLCFEEKPDLGKRVVYYRFNKGKFGVGKRAIHTDEDGNQYERWVNEYSTCHEVSIDDRWIYLPPLTFQKKI